MASHFAGMTTTLIGVGVNTTATIKKGNNPFPGLLAGGMLVAAVVVIGEATDPRLGAAFGATFLVGCLLINGSTLINISNDVTKAGKGLK